LRFSRREHRDPVVLAAGGRGPTILQWGSGVQVVWGYVHWYQFREDHEDGDGTSPDDEIPVDDTSRAATVILSNARLVLKDIHTSEIPPKTTYRIISPTLPITTVQMTYTNDPSHVINTVQLNPRIDKNPNLLFSTAFFPNRASAISSCLSVERVGATLSSISLFLVIEVAITHEEGNKNKRDATETVKKGRVGEKATRGDWKTNSQKPICIDESRLPCSRAITVHVTWHPYTYTPARRQSSVAPPRNFCSTCCKSVSSPRAPCHSDASRKRRMPLPTVPQYMDWWQGCMRR